MLGPAVQRTCQVSLSEAELLEEEANMVSFLGLRSRVIVPTNRS